MFTQSMYQKLNSYMKKIKDENTILQKEIDDVDFYIFHITELEKKNALLKIEHSESKINILKTIANIDSLDEKTLIIEKKEVKETKAKETVEVTECVEDQEDEDELEAELDNNYDENQELQDKENDKSTLYPKFKLVSIDPPNKKTIIEEDREELDEEDETELAEEDENGDNDADNINISSSGNEELLNVADILKTITHKLKFMEPETSSK